MNIDLAFVWAALIALSVLMYVVMDGFDLGIGILFPFLKRPEDRDVAMNSIAPIWDGNETWLVLGGGGLLAVFPLAYSLLMTAFYAPLIVMLLALVFRGVAFEFRFRDPRHRFFWDHGFSAGSFAATFCQGIVLGTFVQGIEVEGRSYAGGWFGWLTPFSVFTALALVAGYALLGATWLVMKTEGELQARVRRLARPLALGTIAAIVAVSVWTPFLNLSYAMRWFATPNMFYLSPVPVLVAATAWALWRSLGRDQDVQPFLCALVLFVLSFAGLAISLYPYLVPPQITIYEAAAPRESLAFLLAGAAVLLPIILVYTAHSYWVFRGKVRAGEGYH
jgi:cytochrome d ubiquinol oxidase subunit II